MMRDLKGLYKSLQRVSLASYDEQGLKLLIFHRLRISTGTLEKAGADPQQLHKACSAHMSQKPQGRKM